MNDIRELYPEVELIEAWDGPLEMGDDPHLQKRHEAYILGRLADRAVCNFYSSEFYGEHVSRALGAVDRRVDEQRQRIPISGTAIRAHPHANRQYLEPLVYRDLITRVVFLGAPSTGKTTLATVLAEKYQTCWMPEYGREYWELHRKGRRLTLEQLVEIAEVHRRREDRLMLDADRYLFVDTDASTTRLFSLYYHGRVDPRLQALAEQSAQHYDLYFLCEDDIPYDDTWDRSGIANRRLFQDQVRSDLACRKIPYICLQGSLQQRLEKVKRVLDKYKKYSSLMDELVEK